MTTDAEQMARHLTGLLPNVCVGALRFWGEWFGRPYDNWHSLVACEAKGDVLFLRYNEDELLTIWSPRQLKADESTFRISDAQRVRWEWFAYGRSKIAENRYFMDFIKVGDGVDAKTDVDWYSPNLRPTTDFPAVEIPRALKSSS